MCSATSVRPSRSCRQTRRGHLKTHAGFAFPAGPCTTVNGHMRHHVLGAGTPSTVRSPLVNFLAKMLQSVLSFGLQLRWLNVCGAAGVFWELQPAARQCSSSQQASQDKTGSCVRCGVPMQGRRDAVARILPRYKVQSNTSCAVVPLVSAEWSHSAVCNVKGCSSLELCILSFCVAMSTRAASCL